MSRATALAAASVLLPALAGAQEVRPKRPDLEVVLMVDGGMTPEPMHYFLLKVNFSGEVEGGGDLNPGLPPPPHRLSALAHGKLAALLERERFFSRPIRNLGCAPDLGGRVITAWRGTTRRSLSFCVEEPGLPLRETQSALRLWYGVLSVVANGKRVPVADADRRLLAKKR